MLCADPRLSNPTTSSKLEMSAPTPPKVFENQCAVVQDNVLYVYSPGAFQSIQLQKNATWEELENGISVTGAACVTAIVDGDNNNQALYVIGGITNSSISGYSGLQRYAFGNKTWETIQLPSDVMQNRVRHGAGFIPKDQKLVVYGGTATEGYNGASSETFTIDLKVPFAVAGYESNHAPPTSRPFVMPWGFDSVVMAGGSSTNREVFTFTSTGGWANLNANLDAPLPDASVAQAAMYTLADASKIMQVIQMGQDPIAVTSHILLNAGALPAVPGATIGGSSPPSSRMRRQFLNNYPTYNESSVPSQTRTDFSLAQGSDGLTAIVGGDSNSSVTFFNQADNSWVPAERVLGEVPQEVLQTSTSASSSRTTPTATASSSPTSTPAVAAASASSDSGSKTWTILGGVLGGLCGLVALLIIILLCLRNKRREKKRNEKTKSYPPGKKASTDLDFEDGLHPLRPNGQPMGRSPVPSQVITFDRSSAALFSSRPDNLIRRISSDNRSQPDTQAATYGIFRREKSPLTKSALAISKPMNPHLGDYQERPSIDLGRATPASPVNATPMVAIPSRNKSNRKTDEAWAKYFNGEKVNPAAEHKQQQQPAVAAAAAAAISPRRPKSRGGSGFWPGSGAPSAPVPPKFAFRDSAGNTLQTRSVGTASPALEDGPQEANTRYLQTASPRTGRISNANSMSDDGSEYEDAELDPAFSSGVPASVQGNPYTSSGNWNTIGAGPRTNYDPPPTAFTTNSSGGASQSTGSSVLGAIPNFPMPGMSTNANKVTVAQVQHPATTHARSASRENGVDATGYFPPMRGNSHSVRHQRDPSNEVNTDVSWLNLGGGGGNVKQR